MKRDYSHLWRLPDRLPPGSAFYAGVIGLVHVLAMALLAVVFAL
jgi:hypothetical protein